MIGLQVTLSPIFYLYLSLFVFSVHSIELKARFSSLASHIQKANVHLTYKRTLEKLNKYNRETLEVVETGKFGARHMRFRAARGWLA